MQWSTFNELVLGNTYFDDGGSGAWTYRNGNLLLQNDYILFDKPVFKRVCACMVRPDVDTGSDHRCVSACLKMVYPTEVKQTKKMQPSKRWSVHGAVYRKELDAYLEDCDFQSYSAEVRLDYLQTSMVKASLDSIKAPEQRHIAGSEAQLIRELIEKQRHLQNEGLRQE